MRKLKNILILTFIIIIFMQGLCFASTDQFRGFLAIDCTDLTSVSTISYAIWTFEKLGYINATGTGTYTTTGSKNTVLSYIGQSSNNYGFYERGHGSSALFAMLNGSSEVIYPSDISGNWHFVFLDSCSCLATTNFANAFKTNGYSSRATLGWYQLVYSGDALDWWSHFYPLAGTTNIRAACLSAADSCSGSTPIKMYGDTNWWGYAW